MGEAVAYYICRSQLRVEMSVEELDALYEACTEQNEATGVTGFLALHDGYFYHFFEGSDTACDTLFELMQKDMRHQDMRVLGAGLSYHRQFADWNMSFMRATDAHSPQFGACPTGLGRFLRQANAEAVLNHLLSVANSPFLAEDPKLEHSLRSGMFPPGAFRIREPLIAAE